MADHVYKPWEVPKGQRWDYFLDYYKKPAIVVLLILLAMISILRATVFAPKPDVHILAASYIYVDYETWDNITEAMRAMDLDYNGDGKSLAEVNAIHFDEKEQAQDPQAFVAMQTRLAAAIDAAESALQIVDEDTLPYFEEQGLLATFDVLPDRQGHEADEVIKIPLEELAPFKDIKNLPTGLYMTLRPKELMRIGNNQKKENEYKYQQQALLTMMTESKREYGND